MKLYCLAYLKKDILIVTIQFAYTTFAGTEDTQVYKMHPGTERLILCVNLAGLRDARRANQTVYLGVSVKVSAEEIRI